MPIRKSIYAMRIRTLPLRTKYWKPGTPLLNEIIKILKGRIRDDDFIVISEKAVCTSLGSIVDESKVKAGRVGYLLAKYWMRIIWGYFLGYVARLDLKNIQRIRRYPIQEGAAHKEVSLRSVGLYESLKNWSEGGIDTSNLPYHLSSLPLKNPKEIVSQIEREVFLKLGCRINIILGDSDKTFSFRTFHFSTRKSHTQNIHNFGVFGFIAGRLLRCRPRSTPIAYIGRWVGVNFLLNLTAHANKARGFGAGRTVWDMAERFGSSITEVTWEMLESVDHYPVVIIRFRS